MNNFFLGDKIKSDEVKKSKPNINKKPQCQYCGKASTKVMFAAYLCDSEECENRAYDDRGGPAGHKKDPKKWIERNKE
jgi:hypothetical protein